MNDSGGVTIGSITFHEVAPARDRDTNEAVERVRSLPNKRMYPVAFVDRYEGLLLLQGPAAPSTPGLHLQTPLCGYEGTGPRATAEILALLGFGEIDDLYAQLKTGNNHRFTR